ncbi:hypothetical protein KAK07_19495 [Ideonella sp. 4Y16]|uniref:hypothetical protein n=1 Tax=Ideonella alba TaxID=2824118 RepID=UPI001B3622FE|nr:hypothetical protein [Ideonella alba]MBQ0945533.1 hypothetical protein [Ideonella alba]
MSAPTNQQLALRGAAASIFGATLGVYAGANVLVPAVGSGAVWYIGSKLLKPTDPRYLGAMSVLAGHTLWLLAGMALLNQWGLNTIDLMVFGVGALWLWIRPGLTPVVVLTVFELIALVTNASTIASEQLGSDMHKALVVHIALRVAVLVLLWGAWLKARRDVPSGT